MNESVYSDPILADLLLRGDLGLDALTQEERFRFTQYQFARLNVAEYILDLEAEGVYELSFRYIDVIVNEYRTKPGLQEFIDSVEDTWAGSVQLYSRLAGR